MHCLGKKVGSMLFKKDVLHNSYCAYYFITQPLKCIKQKWIILHFHFRTHLLSIHVKFRVVFGTMKEEWRVND